MDFKFFENLSYYSHTDLQGEKYKTEHLTFPNQQSLTLVYPLLNDFIQTKPDQLGQSIINNQVPNLGIEHGLDPTIQGNENEATITKENEKNSFVLLKKETG